jgi:uncharacterized Zn-finger protein
MKIWISRNWNAGRDKIGTTTRAAGEFGGAMRSLITGLVLSVLATLAFAHHSGAMFDQAKSVTLAGTVKEYQFTHPHVWIEVMVPDAKGKAVQWSVEGEGPTIMARLGLKPRVLKAGDKITLRAHPLRDGRPGGSFISITLADGQVVGTPRRPPAAPPATTTTSPK